MFKRRRAAERIDTLIGKATRITGDLEFSGGLHLDGSVSGSVLAEPGSSSTMFVSEHGRVDGSVTATNVVLNGAVRGDIVASGRVVLGAQAWVEGDVLYGAIEMAAGAQVRGRLVPQHGPLRAPEGRLPVASSAVMALGGTNAVQSL